MKIIDATVSGTPLHTFTLDSLAERMTAREIIRARIYQEVRDHNAAMSETFRGFIQPKGAEPAGHSFRMRKEQKIDWEEQFRRACEAFETNGFFLLVGDRQAESLDERFTVGVETEVQFVKLTPLVGG